MKTSIQTTWPRHAQHLVVFRRDDMCANWPFVGGLWRWDDCEIAVSFSAIQCAYSSAADVEHGRIETFGEQLIARSYDDGATWPAEEVKRLYSKPDIVQQLAQGQTSKEPVRLDYSDPNAIIRCHYVNDGIEQRNLRVSFVMGSPDRGNTWPQGPVPVRAAHLGGVQGLSRYIVRPDKLVLLFVEAWYKDSALPHGLRPHIFASDDGGANWYYYNSLPVEERPGYFYCHPSPVLLKDGRILCAVRAQFAGTVRCAHAFLYESDDGARNWTPLGRLNDYGGTPHLLRLRDGRLLCTTERRMPPYGIRARLSEDDRGRTWGPEIVLRDDGGSWDLGYSCSCQRRDGSIMTFYYFNCADDPIQCHGGVRHIAATIWEP